MTEPHDGQPEPKRADSGERPMTRMLKRCGLPCNASLVIAIYLATTAFFLSLACLVMLGAPGGFPAWF